jgi:hypothetical protein
VLCTTLQNCKPQEIPQKVGGNIVEEKGSALRAGSWYNAILAAARSHTSIQDGGIVMKVSGFCATNAPKRKSTGMFLLEEALEAGGSQGAETETLRLSDYTILRQQENRDYMLCIRYGHGTWSFRTDTVADVDESRSGRGSWDRTRHRWHRQQLIYCSDPRDRSRVGEESERAARPITDRLLFKLMTMIFGTERRN